MIIETQAKKLTIKKKKEINNLRTGPRQLKLIDAKPFTQQAVVNAY